MRLITFDIFMMFTFHNVTFLIVASYKCSYLLTEELLVHKYLWQ